jgi:light-regulated signal transduction histidine kinase (bacteriophytochrome)
MNSKEGSPSEAPSVAWPDVVKFIRQLGHDIRNNLNAVELQSAYLGELADEHELKGEVQRLREMVSELGSGLQKLSAALSQTTPTLINYDAADFVEDLKEKLAKDFPSHAAKIKWDVQLKNEKLEVDAPMAQQALVELFANAFQNERTLKSIAAKAYIDPPSQTASPARTSGAAGNGRFVFELHETKTKFELPTKNWGREPLQHLSQGHYGLGLNRTRVIAEAHGGTFGANYDAGTSMLATKLTLPILREG